MHATSNNSSGTVWTVLHGACCLLQVMATGSNLESKRMMLNVACMSRAGREPGFKKTNQDNCFAFEKYITEDQSLFGALDGHGPNGTQWRIWSYSRSKAAKPLSALSPYQ